MKSSYIFLILFVVGAVSFVEAAGKKRKDKSKLYTAIEVQDEANKNCESTEYSTQEQLCLHHVISYTTLEKLYQFLLNNHIEVLLNISRELKELEQLALKKHGILEAVENALKLLEAGIVTEEVHLYTSMLFVDMPFNLVVGPVQKRRIFDFNDEFDIELLVLLPAELQLRELYKSIYTVFKNESTILQFQELFLNIISQNISTPLPWCSEDWIFVDTLYTRFEEEVYKIFKQTANNIKNFPTIKNIKESILNLYDSFKNEKKFIGIPKDEFKKILTKITDIFLQFMDQRPIFASQLFAIDDTTGICYFNLEFISSVLKDLLLTYESIIDNDNIPSTSRQQQQQQTPQKDTRHQGAIKKQTTTSKPKNNDANNNRKKWAVKRKKIPANALIPLPTILRDGDLNLNESKIFITLDGNRIFLHFDGFDNGISSIDELLTKIRNYMKNEVIPEFIDYVLPITEQSEIPLFAYDLFEIVFLFWKYVEELGDPFAYCQRPHRRSPRDVSNTNLVVVIEEAINRLKNNQSRDDILLQIIGEKEMTLELDATIRNICSPPPPPPSPPSQPADKPTFVKFGNSLGKINCHVVNILSFGIGYLFNPCQ